VTVDVIIPWRPGCPDRERALEYVLRRWDLAGHFVTLAENRTGPWNKAAAVMPAAWRSAADVLVIADADVWCDDIEPSLELVASGRRRWAVPHGRVHRLDQAATDELLAAGTFPTPDRLAERPYRGHPGGGIVVIDRATCLDVPLDPRFVGWGHEDDAWALALGRLAGAPGRGTAPLWHLWHPPQPRLNRRVGSRDSQIHFRRYVTAARNRAAMTELINEAKGALLWATLASS
jgi:hypothetical protein